MPCYACILRKQAVPFDGKNLPLFIGVVIYSFEGCGAILPIENALADPSQFSTLCTTVFATFFVIYLLIGGVGFLSFEFDDPSLPENDKGTRCCAYVVTSGSLSLL